MKIWRHSSNVYLKLDFVLITYIMSQWRIPNFILPLTLSTTTREGAESLTSNEKFISLIRKHLFTHNNLVRATCKHFSSFASRRSKWFTAPALTTENWNRYLYCAINCTWWWSVFSEWQVCWDQTSEHTVQAKEGWEVTLGGAKGRRK